LRGLEFVMKEVYAQVIAPGPCLEICREGMKVPARVE
jgi:hypothetical protein